MVKVGIGWLDDGHKSGDPQHVDSEESTVDRLAGAGQYFHVLNYIIVSRLSPATSSPPPAPNGGA
jgi:hypothetical protein